MIIHSIIGLAAVVALFVVSSFFWKAPPTPQPPCEPIQEQLASREKTLDAQYVAMMDGGLTGKQITLVADELKAVRDRLQAIKEGTGHCQFRAR